MGLVALMWVTGGMADVAAQSPSGPTSVVPPQLNLPDGGDLGLPGDPPNNGSAKKAKSGKSAKSSKSGKSGKGMSKKKRNVNRTFQGFGFDDNATENGGFRFIPPDPIGAAGKSWVIAVANTMIESRTKGGKLKWRDSLSDFFAPLTPATLTFDPKIVYDQLYLTTTILPNAGPDLGQTTAHWFQLDTSGVTSSTSPAGLITLADQGNIGGEDLAPGTFTFFPAVAVNKNDEVMFGFSASAPTIFAGAYAARRSPADPPATVGATQTIQAGLGPYQRFFGGPRNRRGDYSGISVDPTDQKKFWVFNEFADTPGTPGTGTFGPEDGRWGTAWGRTK